jgi:hypothetical protein
MASTITAGNATNGLALSCDNTGILELKTGTGAGTTAVTIGTGQNVTFLNTLSVGNATPSSSGAGITFPATQSASSDANTLDDYEEGTWTPTLSSIGASWSYSAQSGSYIKIGQLVYAQFYLLSSASGTTTNAVTLAGLPFTVTSVNSPFEQGGSCYWQSSTTATSMTVNTGATTATIWRQNAGTTPATAANITGTYLVGTLIYRASA